MRGMDDDTQAETGNTRVLANGAIYDMTKKRIVANPGGGTSAIASASQAQALVARKMQLKRERLAAGANRVVAEGGQWDGTGQDYVEAIGEALMQTALNVDSSRQVHASELLLRETGIAEQRQSDQPANLQVNIIRIVLHDDDPQPIDTDSVDVTPECFR